MSEELNITALYEKHLEHKAEMGPIGDWQMPLFYQDIPVEAAYVRAHAGIIDRGYSTIIRFAGKGAAKALDGRCALPVADQAVGECRRNLLLNITGGVIEVVYLCHMAEDDFLLITGDENTKAVANALTGALTKFLKVEDLSDYLARIDLVGAEAVSTLTASGIALPEAGHCATTSLSDTLRGIVCHITDCGLDGVMILFNEDNSVELWERLAALSGVVPCGLETLEQIRIENAIPAFPWEWDEETPLNDSGMSGLFLPAARKFFGRPALERTPGRNRLAVLHLSDPDLLLEQGSLTSIAPCPGADGKYAAIGYLPIKCTTPAAAEGTVEFVRNLFA